METIFAIAISAVLLLAYSIHRFYIDSTRAIARAADDRIAHLESILRLYGIDPETGDPGLRPTCKRFDGKHGEPSYCDLY